MSLSQVDPSQETRTKKEQLQRAEWGSVGLEFSQPLKELRHEISRNSKPPPPKFETTTKLSETITKQ